MVWRHLAPPVGDPDCGQHHGSPCFISWMFVGIATYKNNNISIFLLWFNSTLRSAPLPLPLYYSLSRLPIDPSLGSSSYPGPYYHLISLAFYLLSPSRVPHSPATFSFIPHPLLTCCFLFPIVYSGAKKYLVSHQFCKFSHLKRWEACNFYHRYTSAMRDEMKKII